jgi:hypothetical protein
MTTVDGYYLNPFPTFFILSTKLFSTILDNLEFEKVLDIFHIKAFFDSGTSSVDESSVLSVIVLVELQY